MYIKVIHLIFFQLSEKEHSKVKVALDSQWVFSLHNFFSTWDGFTFFFFFF